MVQDELVTDPGIRDLFQRADQLARAGNRTAAAKLFEQILERRPQHLAALTFLSMTALDACAYERSVKLMERAAEVESDNAVLQQNLGLILRKSGEPEKALAALDRAIELEPRYAVAYLHRGAALEDLSRVDEALESYRKAVQLEPGLRRLNERTPRIVLELAQRANDLKTASLRRVQDEAFESVRERYGSEETRRLERFLRGHQKLDEIPFADPLQRPGYQYFPDIPPQPWFERDAFEWVEAFEAAADTICDEVNSVVEENADLKPYVSGDRVPPPKSEHFASWNALAESLTWSSYHLLEGGERIDEHCTRCPETLAAVEQLPLVYAQGHAPEAFFSILKPGAYIPPHFGLANTKLAVHLALMIPEDCAIRVGPETRGWTEGQCLIFDDSFEHEAWNRSDQTRAVLITEVWNPALTEPEREGISAIVRASDDFGRRWAESVTD